MESQLKAMLDSIAQVLQEIFPHPLQNQIFLVGGTVRGILLGQPLNDIDLAAAIPHDNLLALGFRLVETTSASTIYFRHHPALGNIEVTRIDSISCLNADLLRRDFTINAMAMNLAGDRIDPLHGVEDLKTGLLRTCTTDSFSDDPLRIFRAFRFEAGGWRMTPETEALIRSRGWRNELCAIPVERFSNEMIKSLAGRSPERFFQRMVELTIGEVILPELFRMPLIPAGPREHHPEGDLFTHSTEVLQRVAAITPSCLARFCAFFHDLGKLATDPACYPRHHGHDEEGFRMATGFCARLCLPTTYRKALAGICRLHGKANLWDSLRDVTRLKIAQQAIRAGITEVLPQVAASDKPGGLPMQGWETTLRIAQMNSKELGIDQEKLQQMPPGKRPAFILQTRITALRESKRD